MYIGKFLLCFVYKRSMKSTKMITEHLVLPSLFQKTWLMVTSTIREKSTDSGLSRYPSNSQNNITNNDDVCLCEGIYLFLVGTGLGYFEI